MLKNIFKDFKLKHTVIYVLSFIITLTTLIIIANTVNIKDFLEKTENKTFDTRQVMLVNNKAKIPNKDIVIVAIDDASYEYLLDKYGEWPIPRNVYADLINYIERSNPKEIAFDLMFVKSMKSSHNDDLLLSNTMNKYNNIFTGMNFDNEQTDVRLPQALPDRLSVNLKSDTKKNPISILTYSNCRTILSRILDGKASVGIINASRETDGILRKLPPFLMYQNKFYP